MNERSYLNTNGSICDQQEAASARFDELWVGSARIGWAVFSFPSGTLTRDCVGESSDQPITTNTHSKTPNHHLSSLF